MHLVMVGSTTPSHVYPSLALIAELVARGHRVSYLIGDRLAHAGRADRRAGRSPTRRCSPTPTPRWPEDAGAAMRMFLDDQIAVLPALLERRRTPTPSCTTSAASPGRVAAHHWGVPAIQLSPTYVAWEGYEEDMAEFTEALKTSESGAGATSRRCAPGSTRTAWRSPATTSSGAPRRASC